MGEDLDVRMRHAFCSGKTWNPPSACFSVNPQPVLVARHCGAASPVGLGERVWLIPRPAPKRSF